MPKLRIVSIILFLTTITGFILWRFVVLFPDWLVRVNGIFMLAAIFIFVFSTARITMSKAESK